MCLEKHDNMSLPRYAVILNNEERHVDDAAFFQALSQLDARDPNILRQFMDSYRGVKVKILGLSECVQFQERLDESPEFEQFSVDLWREFYIQEDIIQIGFLEDKQPFEVIIIKK